ncbi:PREDICTED: uncharacterized protein LOC106742050 [Dinoponera quadriceps]|uniref:Uncharacterized protein LOC106742050 n=1 Tax=Dinoponera quadriceps TaxID=609295 RepID=A0A6P3WVQ1_DINQU|nr:PREDICTED: uncharacterized protein LOC106742050 [Dinoponera quadriceps]
MTHAARSSTQASAVIVTFDLAVLATNEGYFYSFGGCRGQLCQRIRFKSNGVDPDDQRFATETLLKPCEMRSRMSFVRFLACLLLVAVVRTTSAYAEPEPMARPTRPKAIASPEELERYLDIVRDYYSLRRARYGKRGGDTAPRMSELNSTWETLKTILDVQRQNQQRRLGKLKPSKEQEIAYRDYHGLDADRHRLATRSGYLLDAVGRYYDDVQ